MQNQYEINTKSTGLFKIDTKSTRNRYEIYTETYAYFKSIRNQHEIGTESRIPKTETDRFYKQMEYLNFGVYAIVKKSFRNRAEIVQKT